MINDRIGSFNFFSASASYAYHLGLNPTTNLAGGFLPVSPRWVLTDPTNFDGNGDQFDPATASGTYEGIAED